VNRTFLLLLALIWLLVPALQGCGTASRTSAPPEAPALAPPLPPLPPAAEGSLWRDRQPNGLMADHRALNVGDLVTISITEAAKASEMAKTDTSKTSGVKTTVGSLFGLSFPMNAFSNKEINVDTALEGTVGNTAKGEGKTERQSTFTTFLTARVIQVLPNQHLVVQGRRHLRINNETEVVTITGIVRPTDIDRNNTVPSTRVADARLEISGVGVISDKQRQGWLTRILDHLWPI
jgi:flagellar L-ring protein precursor FlgH